MKYAAVDLGAESGRVIVGDVENMEVICRFPNRPVRIGDSIFWDTPGLFLEIKKGLKQAFDKYGDEIVSIGFDTWGVDYGLLDKQGDLIGLPYHYRDQRTDQSVEVFEKIVDRQTIYRETGIQFMQINTLYQLYEHGKKAYVRDAACTFLTTPDLLGYWMTGIKANDYTMATTTQIFNPGKRCWSKTLTDALPFDQTIFQDILMPGKVLGRLRPHIAEEIGAAETVTVVNVGGHDTACAVAAVPVVDDAEYAFLSSGTWSLLGVETPQPVITEKSLEYNFTNEGTVNGEIRLLKNIMGLWIVQECKRFWDSTGDAQSYAELTQAAKDNGPAAFSIDVNADRFLKPGLTDDSMPDRIRAWCRETGQPLPDTKGAMVRGILESLAATYAETLTRLEELNGKSFDVLNIIGGGTQNELLSQLTADAVGIPVKTGPIEATAIGNMLTQAICHGQIAGYAEGRALIRKAYPVKEFQPGSSE